MQTYDPIKGEWTDSDSGKILKLNCGEQMDDISILIAKVVFKPWLAQSVYADMCKIVRGSKQWHAQ